jgi:large conductance mechanosensitive channel
MLKEFQQFLLKTNALALAVGVIIGGAVGKVVSSLVADILMPIIGIGIPGGVWRDLKVPLTHNADGTVGAALGVGPFLGTLIDFVIISLCVFLITKAILKPEPAPPAPPSKTCPECLESVALAAKKCRHCGSAV